MSRVLFSIRYEIVAEQRDEFLRIIRELKNLVKAEGLEQYSVFEHKKKPNHFEELFLFESKEAYEEYDDFSDERVEILMNQLSGMIKQQSTNYSTLYEVENN